MRKAATATITTTEKTTTNSGLIFGPPLSVSKKRIIPIAELGPELSLEFLVNFTWIPNIILREKNFNLHW